MPDYNHESIEKKWQALWQESSLYKTTNISQKPKFYCLDMFPYPSGTGLHVGHPKGYIATDIVARSKMMQGFNVLHPMGWDAFGLPAENYAIKNKTHPSVAVAKNIEVYKRQLEILGLAFDWSREINTTDPEYYKWTQWAFAEMFKRGLVYESHEPINWCPTCQTGLANEDLEDGKCERCGTPVEKKPLRQWVIRITDYAESLLADLETLPDWEDSIKEMQKNWLGKSEGSLVKFAVGDKSIEVFTTRPDTLFGATYLVIAPEHNFVNDNQNLISNFSEVESYIKAVKNKSDLDRTDLNKDKSGVELQGIKAINPVNNEELPIFVADYVLASYGTGAIMAVPAHDERDFEFATKYNLPIKQVVAPLDNASVDGCFTDYGLACDSDFITGLSTVEAKTKMIAWLEEKNIGQKQTNWRLKDWVFSRQRYWGEPIPLIFCEHCKSNPSNKGEELNPGWIIDENLPVTLPKVDHYEPTGTGESPLANIDSWVDTTCPRCGGTAKRETNTMPQWAGSSWYYLRYADPHNSQELISKDLEKYWNPVDLYVGGAEHATRHLIYARFWHKFLQDIGVVSSSEPFKKLRHVGLVLAEDGRKMSKRWNNVVNPDAVVADFGADAMRVYEMFMGPFDQAVAWNTNGVIGARKFLLKISALADKVTNEPALNPASLSLLHKTIAKITSDIDNFKFNTAISALMILVNNLTEAPAIGRHELSIVLQLVAPFAPHLAEELWQSLNNDTSIFKSIWPTSNPELARDETVTITVQINGKVRDQLSLPADLSNEEVEAAAKSSEKIQPWLADKQIVKVVVIPNRLVNFVVV
ncbi:leucine--tRNA ligase [Candidatus Falkowbacteria bacterium CG10_big_fil_rev_8_21_14_0_10_37_14]|uniref:Leucine--tRNA ligase n=1 Tax=Candidatus Falkowbacteria bacterium CG10_big_fil_rev_8_21_14_0_10_37_14 TaxID=1974561 RepID=A0A2M6WT04_9BACT|nr:leucine--tRNA ligase [Candidatus Falkowbacteria bacterium]PIT95930.1 MAG: leucine--tRNA ligase [Candidatus Falkowbacteria bacterium CG10_big_fil_rev_8_21_14_0_10_37_14]